MLLWMTMWRIFVEEHCYYHLRRHHHSCHVWILETYDWQHTNDVFDS